MLHRTKEYYPLMLKVSGAVSGIQATLPPAHLQVEIPKQEDQEEVQPLDMSERLE